MSNKEDFTIGVEEEYQIINPRTRELQARAERILPAAERAVGDRVTPELYLSQIEIGTSICRTLSDLRRELVRLRREVITAAEAEGNRIAAAATHPFSHWKEQTITPKARYVGISQEYQQLAREQLIFGCHVHVGIRDRELAIQIMNRSRSWLPVILALSANSPFWMGVDTGYASFRTQIWRRWPMAGTPQLFASRDEYDELVRQLVATGSIEDGTKIYWDVRPSARFETIEFRIADVCQTVDEAVMVAGLSRALVHRCWMEERQGEPLSRVRPELLRAAKWRAARYGLDADLIDASEARAVPAAEMVEKFLDHLRPALEEQDEWEHVSALVNQTIARGNGATRQRAAYQESGSYESVVDLLVAETSRGVI
jgi:carboxylate-amine ligase